MLIARILQLMLVSFLVTNAAMSVAEVAKQPAPPDPPQQAALPPFAYEPFPAIPIATVTPNQFVSRLVASCERVTAAATPRCKDAPSPASSGPKRTRNQLVQAARSFTFDEKEATCSDPGTVQDLAREIDMLRLVCMKMQTHESLSQPDVDLLHELAKDSPLLDLLEDWDLTLAKLADASNQPDGSLQSGAPAVSGLGVIGDRAIRGLADFLADRAKQETLIYLQQQLKDKLCEGETKEFLRHSCAALASVSKEQPLGSMAAYFRAAVAADLQALPDASLALAAYKRPRELKGASVVARLLLAMAAEIQSGRHPTDVVYSVAEIEFPACPECGKVYQGLRLASAIAYALAQQGDGWVEYYRKVKSPSWSIATVGVLVLTQTRLESIKKERCPTGAGNDCPVLGLDAYNNGLRLGAIWADMIELDQRWSAVVDQLQSARAGNPQADRTGRIAAAIVHGVGKAVDFTEHVAALVLQPSDLRAMSEYTIHVRGILKAAGSVAEKRYDAALIATLEELSRATIAVDLPANVSTYVPFLVEVVTAESSDGVVAALDAYAAPLASYGAKYKRPMVALNGFVGAIVGGERIDNNGVNGNSVMISAYAPVGVHLTTPAGETGADNSFHVGAMISLIDLGALTSYRFDRELDGDLDADGAPPAEGEDAVASHAPEVGFDQVFSPGLAFTLGLGGSPLVLGVGASLSPALRRVTQDGIEQSVPVVRFGLSIGVDIPIFIMN